MTRYTLDVDQIVQKVVAVLPELIRGVMGESDDIQEARKRRRSTSRCRRSSSMPTTPTTCS